MFEQEWRRRQIMTTIAMQYFAYGSSTRTKSSNAASEDAMNDATDPLRAFAERVQRQTVDRRDAERSFLDPSECVAELPHLAGRR